MKTPQHIIIAASLLFFIGCSEGETNNTSTQAEETSSLPAAQDTAPLPAPVQEQAAGTTAGGSAGLNPAHGEPGHRCDIAVGAPLNSTPQAPITTQPQVTPQVQQPSISMPVQQPQAPVQGTSTGKVNPAHGEPGHDCSIPVGSPLK